MRDDRDLRALRKERDRLRDIFNENGGRGVDLAEAIDEIEARIEVLEHPLKLKEALRIVLKLAGQYIDEVGYPEDESIADTERLRIAYVDQAIEKVEEHLK